MCSQKSQAKLGQLSQTLPVPAVTCDVQWWTSEDECKWVSIPHDLFSWNKHDLTLLMTQLTFEYIDKGFLTMLTLCMLGPLCHAGLFFPSSSCSMLPPSLLGLDCLSRSLSWGLALPHPLPSGWPHFPQVPGNTLPLCRALYPWEREWRRRTSRREWQDQSVASWIQDGPVHTSTSHILEGQVWPYSTVQHAGRIITRPWKIMYIHICLIIFSFPFLSISQWKICI
jgi:hypothetical protein